MAKIGFAWIHSHSCHSKRDAFPLLSEIAGKAAANNIRAFALTDHGVMHGVPEAFREAKKVGVKAIAGCEVYETDKQGSKDKHYHMILLAKNKVGYHNLVKIVSNAHTEGFYGNPRTDWELLEKYSEGIIATSACLASRVNQSLLKGEYEQAKTDVLRYQKIYGEDYYLEIQTNDMPEQQMVNKQLIQISQETGIKLVGTSDSHYIDKEDAVYHQAMLCLGRAARMLKEDTPAYGGESPYFYHTAKEAFMAFKKQGIDQSIIIEALNNSVEIADKCTFDLQKEKDLLPQIEGVDDIDSKLAAQVTEGFKRKLGPIVRKDKKLFETYKTRVSYELKVIREKGYADYFYIVSDFLRYAKSRGIAVGPGRGSSAGSLICYLLDITEVDPIEHSLYFERFLDVTRLKMPDIDTDIEDTRRHEVYEYIQEKYGRENVAQIGTAGRMTAKKAFKNALMVYDVPFKQSLEITGMIPDELGITIAKAYQMNPELKRIRKAKVTRADGQVIDLEVVFKTAEKFEMKIDQHGKHAAGVLITPGPVDQFFPILGRDGERITQYDKDDIEELGGVKFDLLGLKTLTILGLAKRSAEKEFNIEIDLNDIMRKADDKAVYDIITKGDTADLFQINSDGMQQLCKRVKPNKFSDVVAITALYRPPTLASGDTWAFADKRTGKEKAVYDHPDEIRITGETYGIITYQEHVMELVHQFAGWDYSAGDKLRKMKTEQLEELREKFVTDGFNRNYDEEPLQSIWSRIVRYMGYGFNKAHAIAYTKITYATAWFKVNYPEHWIAAQMTVNMGDQVKVGKAFEAIKAQGFEFIPPDANLSDHFFTASKGKIVFPLGTIKGVGDKAVQSILDNKPYASMEDLMNKCDLRLVTKRAMKPIILAGGFDLLYPGLNRQQIYAKYLDVRRDPQKVRDEWAAEIWDDDKQSAYEMEYIGIYVSKHPMEKYGFRNFFTEYPEYYNGAVIGGPLTKVKGHTDKKGNKMAFITVDTLYGEIEGVVFANVYSNAKALLKKGNSVLINGNKEDKKILVNKVEELGQ